MVNNGSGESIAKKMAAVGLTLTRNNRCGSTLTGIQRVYHYNKRRKKSVKYRASRAQLRNREYELHDKAHDAPSPSTYHTDQLLHDHSYPLNQRGVVTEEVPKTLSTVKTAVGLQ